MKIKNYFFAFVATCCLPNFCFAQNAILSEIQSENLVSNINYIQYSVARIKASDNKAVAEDEFYSVINDLDLNSINSSQLLILEYKEFLAHCSGLKLKQNEKDFLRQLNEKAQKSAYLSAFSNMGSVFVPGQSPQQLVASLVYTTVSNAFAIANTKNQLKTQLEKDMFYLDQDMMKEIYGMETSLFATSATLLSGKMSQKRINDDSMQTFVKVLKLESENEKLNALNESNIRENFSAFPPLWYELGNAYQNTGNSSSALRCYRQFEQLKKYDALKKDKNYINVLKNKIQIYLGPDKANVLANAKRHKEEILDCIALIKANYLDSESGEMNSYLARIYYLIGETSESLKCLDYLISLKTLHPEYIEEAIALRSLIRSASQTEYSEIYQVAFNFGKVMYGNDNAEVQQIVKKTTGFWNSIKNWLKNCFRFFGRIFGKKYTESFCDDNHICFEIPNGLINEWRITALINDKLYSPELIKLESEERGTICFLDFNLKDINDGITLELQFDSKNSNNNYIVKYSITPFSKKHYKAADKAYARIGSDIMTNNAQKVVEFGNAIFKYKYKVSDEQKLNKRIRRKIEKEGKKKSMTKSEIGSAVTKEFFEQLAPDLNFLQERYQAVESSYYKQEKGILCSPRIAVYNDEYYLVGITSLYNCKSGETTIFTSEGELISKSNPTSSEALQSSDIFISAALGDINCIISVAKSYLNGYGVKKNEAEAVRWLLKAASLKGSTLEEKLSVTEAYEQLGRCYWEGIGVVKNRSTATIWFQKAKEYGFDIESKYLE